MQYLLLKAYRRKIQFIGVLCLFPVFLAVQSVQAAEAVAKKEVETTGTTVRKTAGNPKPLIAPPVLPSVKRNELPPSKQLHLEHTETLTYDAFVNPEYQVLTGDVRFRHEGATLFCDSAHYYRSNNSLYAYGNVHMEQGDSLFLYGAWLFYDGNTRLVMVREKVRLENRKVTLFTDSLNYDRVTNIGYFFDGGLLVNEEKNETNELSSEYGQYSPVTKLAEFKNDVKLVNPKFVMTNRELKYNTVTGVASIFCPTRIVSDSAFIYSDKGTYDTRSDKSQLFDRSYILSNHRKITADTIYYDRKNGIGEAFGKVVLIDSTQQLTFKGGYSYSEDRKNYALMSKNALMVEHSTKDTLFLHADTLITRMDSVYRAVTAFHGTRFYRVDFQGVCDSLYYSTRDSVLSFFGNPVIWSDQQQLTGDFMQLHTKNNQADYLHIQRAAMAISQETDSLYNQTSGKDLKAFFEKGEIKRVEINGNAETIYLPRDEHRLIIGLNYLAGSFLKLDMENKKMKKIVVWPQPQGTFYPLALVSGNARFLSNFVWYNDIRPKDPSDVFRNAPVVNASLKHSADFDKLEKLEKKPVRKESEK